MSNEDLKRVREFYENVILQKVILPIEINEIYKLVVPSETNPQGIGYSQKQRAITVYIQNLQKEVLDAFDAFFKGVDKIDVVIPIGSAADTSAVQSHSEDNNQHLLERIAELEAEYQTTEDSGRKRSISMKITNMRKKIK
jgi:hypothetical protein